MIIASGYLKAEADNPNRVKRSVVWRDGQLTGNRLAIELLRLRAIWHTGDGIMWHGPVDDWIVDPVAFGVLIIEEFEPDGLEIQADERIAPPPCPDNAVC